MTGNTADPVYEGQLDGIDLAEIAANAVHAAANGLKSTRKLQEVVQLVVDHHEANPRPRSIDETLYARVREVFGE